jgi:hypothetical protein
MDRTNDAGWIDGDIGWPPGTGDGSLHGPNLGRLCVMDGGAHIRVTGRAWDFFDDCDLIEVTIEKADGSFRREQMSMALFAVIEANARLVL